MLSSAFIMTVELRMDECEVFNCWLWCPTPDPEPAGDEPSYCCIREVLGVYTSPSIRFVLTMISI